MKAAKPAVATARLRESKAIRHYRRAARRKHAHRDALSRTRLGAQPKDVRAWPLFTPERAIFDVEDAISKFKKPGIMRHDQHGAAMVSRDAAEDGHDRPAVGAVQSGGR